jgi:biotin carboxyl carrier protein
MDSESHDHLTIITIVATVKVRAPMPGKVLRLLVSPGDEVKEGQPLLILEAMKVS